MRQGAWMSSSSVKWSLPILTGLAYVFRLTIRKLPTPAGGTFIGGHLSLFSPLAKHRFEEKNSTQLGAIYRQRYLARQVVVIADPVLQQEVQDCCPLCLTAVPHETASQALGLSVMLSWHCLHDGDPSSIIPPGVLKGGHKSQLRSEQLEWRRETVPSASHQRSPKHEQGQGSCVH